MVTHPFRQDKAREIGRRKWGEGRPAEGSGDPPASLLQRSSAQNFWMRVQAFSRFSFEVA